MLKKVTVQVKDVNGNTKNKRVVIDSRGKEVSVDKLRGRVSEIDPSILEEPILCSFDISLLRAERAAMMGSHVEQRMELETTPNLTKPKFDPNKVETGECVLNPHAAKFTDEHGSKGIVSEVKITDHHGSKGVVSEVKGDALYNETKLTVKDKHYIAHTDQLDEE